MNEGIDHKLGYDYGVVNASRFSFLCPRRKAQCLPGVGSGIEQSPLGDTMSEGFSHTALV